MHNCQGKNYQLLSWGEIQYDKIHEMLGFQIQDHCKKADLVFERKSCPVIFISLDY